MAFRSVVKTLCILMGLIGFGFPPISGPVVAEQPENPLDDGAGPFELTVILERYYLDGEISEEQVKETIWSIDDFWLRYEGWQYIGMNEKTVVFKQYIDDISPLLKANGYFGLTEDGVLTIFNGHPGQSKIIQSFFQIDVGKLESRKRQQLQNGIPIKTKDQYEKVLETFKPYTRNDMWKK